MPIILYEVPWSGPCHAVKLTAQHLGIKLEVTNAQLFATEHLKPVYAAICPLLTVPAIDDDGFCLWDSHVIMAYLVNKYGNDSPLYPKDPKERAVVDRMLYFEVGTLYASIFSGYMRPQVFEGLPPDPEKKQVVIKNLELLEQLIHETTYMAGDHITVADYSIVGSLSYAEEIGDISLQSYPKILTWMERMRKEVPNFEEIVRIPLKEYKEVVKSRKH